MADTNNVVIVGRLTRDLGELRYGPNGSAIANISIACNRRKKVGERWEEEANYFDVTIYGKTAENLKQWLVKGKQICVTGSLQQQRWEKDGQNHSKVVIIADNIQLLGSNSSSSGGYSGTSAQQQYNSAPQSSGFEPSAMGANSVMNSTGFSSSGFSSKFDEDVPF